MTWWNHEIDPRLWTCAQHSSRSFLTLSLPRHEARERWMELILEGLAGAFAILWKEFPPKMAIQVWSFAEISYNQRIKELVVWYLSNSTVVQDRIPPKRLQLMEVGTKWSGSRYRMDICMVVSYIYSNFEEIPTFFWPTSLEKTRLNSKLRIKSRTKTLDMVLFQRDYCSQWSLWINMNQRISNFIQYTSIYSRRDGWCLHRFNASLIITGGLCQTILGSWSCGHGWWGAAELYHEHPWTRGDNRNLCFDQ